MRRKLPNFSDSERAVRKVLSCSLQDDLIDPIIDEAQNDNPAAEFIVASALETAERILEAIQWYERAAEQGFRPAVERLRELANRAA